MKKVFRIGLVFGIFLMLTALMFAGNVSACRYSDLIAGQEDVAGFISANDYYGNLYIEYHEAAGWTITETHLVVVDDLNDPDQLPRTKKGNLKIGHFPYTGKMSYVIPLADIGDGEHAQGDIIYIIAHAVVIGPECQEETAWADCGNEIPGLNGGWALYFPYKVLRGNIE